MGYRYTEEDIADIQKRQGTNLADFQRNSGRGLPPPTVKAMEKATGVKLDENGAPVPKKAKSKYGNTLTEVDGIRFHSKLEADYYVELELRKKAGEVLYYLRQVAFPLPGGVIYRLDFLEVGYHTGYTGCERLRMEGALDLRGVEPMWIRYVDTKGHETREGKNKIKMVEALYHIHITLVKKVRKLRSK
jgi:hypothetical protein